MEARRLTDKVDMVAAVFAAAALLVALAGLALPMQWGDSTNYSTFEDDGTYLMVGDATVWNDLNIAAVGLGKATSSPEMVPIIGSKNLQGMAFDGGAIKEILYGVIEVPHDYEEHSDIFPHIHWMPTTNDSGTVVWFLEYTTCDVGEVYAGSITVNATSVSSGVAWTSMFANFTVYQTNAIEIGEQIIFALWRDPGVVEDTYPADAVVLTTGIHYKSDTLGSREIETK
jgi:hypothetical protein